MFFSIANNSDSKLLLLINPGLLNFLVCFFASFCASQSLGVLEGFLSLGTDGEGFLGPTEMFESSGVDLLGSRGDWRPPWVERLLLELWVKVDSPAAL